MSIPSELWLWLAVAGLGLFHGINPAMGWLFAVALGLNRHSERAVWLALIPIALGHAVAVAVVLFAVLALGLIDRARPAPPPCRRDPPRLGRMASPVRAPPSRARRHADRPRRFVSVVFPDGERAWRRVDAGAGRAAALPRRIAGARVDGQRLNADRARRPRSPHRRDAGWPSEPSPSSCTNGSASHSCGADGSTSTSFGPSRSSCAGLFCSRSDFALPCRRSM